MIGLLNKSISGQDIPVPICVDFICNIVSSMASLLSRHF